MPSSSMRLTSEASEKRGGGSVKCWVAAIARLSSASPCAHRGQALAFLVLLLVVLAFLIERQEAVELDHRAGRAQVEQARAPTLAAMSTVVRSSSADSIWLAIARIQISS